MTAPATESSPALPPPPARHRRRWVTALFVALVFISGVLVGGAGVVLFVARQARHAQLHPNEIPDRVTARLARKLDLTESQQAQVKSIFLSHRDRIAEIRRDVQPRVERELSDIRSEIAVALTDEQREKWDHMFDELLKNVLPGLSTTRPGKDAKWK